MNIQFGLKRERGGWQYVVVAVGIILFIGLFGVILYQKGIIERLITNEVRRNNLTSEQVISGPVSGNLVPQVITVDGVPRTLYLPSDFQIDVLVKGLDNPTQIIGDDQGNLYGIDSNRLFLISASSPDTVVTVDTDLKGASSLIWYQGSVYVVFQKTLVRYTDIQSDGSYQERKTLIQNLPNTEEEMKISIHTNRIFISIPADCESCNPRDQRKGAIVSYSLDGSDEQIYARGLRYIVSLVSYQDALYAFDIGRKGIAEGLPLGEINAIIKGKDYGWPKCYGKGNTDPKFPKEQDFCENKVELPIREFPYGVGLSSVYEIPNSLIDLLGEGLLFTHRGNAGYNYGVPQGYSVVYKDMITDQAPKNFITGWLEEDGSHWGSPSGVYIQDVGIIYVSDLQNGVIYRITRRD